MLGGYMANKRIKRKKNKQRLQVELQSKKYDKKELKKQSYNSLLKIEQKEIKRKKKRETANKTYKKKTDYLQSIGVDLTGLTVKEIRAIKIKDIDNNNVNQSTYPHLFAKRDINWNKVYKLGNDGFIIAYRDYSGERSFSDCINDYKKAKVDELLLWLDYIVKLPMSYDSKTKLGSSGMSGDYKFMFDSTSNLSLFKEAIHQQNKESIKAIKERQKKRGWRASDDKQHHGYQMLSSKGDLIINETTPKNLLIIGNAVMYNITEIERKNFYKSYYRMIQKYIPKMLDYIPKPE